LLESRLLADCGVVVW